MKVSLTAAAFACLAAAPALAQAPASRPTGRDQAVLQQACAGDFLQFCAGIDPNSPQVEACFERNMRNLSPPCGQAIQAYRQRAGGR